MGNLLIDRRATHTNWDIGSMSRMRSLHLLGFVVLLAVLSLSMGHHKPDHDTETIAPIKDLRGKRLRRSLGETTSARCPCCRECCSGWTRGRVELPKICRECQKKRVEGCSKGEYCAYDIHPSQRWGMCQPGYLSA